MISRSVSKCVGQRTWVENTAMFIFGAEFGFYVRKKERECWISCVVLLFVFRSDLARLKSLCYHAERIHSCIFCVYTLPNCGQKVRQIYLFIARRWIVPEKRQIRKKDRISETGFGIQIPTHLSISFRCICLKSVFRHLDNSSIKLGYYFAHGLDCILIGKIR